MNTQFAFLQLTQDELRDMHRAVMMRWMIESSLRQSQGLEPTFPPPLLNRLEQLLGLNDEAAHELFHTTEDELWDYSWCTYTDEWAWYRAYQEVTQELGARVKHTDHAQLTELIQQRYEERFETYLAEVAMPEEKTTDKKCKHAGLPKKE